MNIHSYGKFSVVIDDSGSKIYDKKINNFMLKNMQSRIVILFSLSVLLPLLINNNGPSGYLRGSLI